MIKSIIFILSWILLLFLSYKFIFLNINEIEEREKNN